jgi:hypothetical protein
LLEIGTADFERGEGAMRQVLVTTPGDLPKCRREIQTDRLAGHPFRIALLAQLR